MNDSKVIVTVAVTGSFGDRKTPYLPITPEEIAGSALAAHEAGAAVVHVHVRDIATGKPSMELELYQEVVERIRSESNMIINLSTGAGARFMPDDNDPIGFASGSTLCIPQKRVEHVLRLKPDLCSLDVGSINFGPHAFVNILSHVEAMARWIKDCGIKPELEVFDLGHIEIANHLIDAGIIAPPPLFQLCLGVRWGIPATVKNMIIMQEALPAGAIWAAFGVGPHAYPMLAQSALLGGHVRIGMEDNLYLEKGKRALNNKELVEKAVGILLALGKKPAGVDEARKMLNLKN